MGYYTRYTLEHNAMTEEERLKIDEFMRDETRFDNYALAPYQLGKDRSTFYGSSGSVKWYGHVEEMIGLAKEFPTVLFTLRGEGEERDDLWVHWFKGERHQRSKGVVSITYSPCGFDN